MLFLNIQVKSAFRKGARMLSGKRRNNPVCKVQDHRSFCFFFFFGWAVNHFNSLINISEKQIFLQDLCPFFFCGKLIPSFLGDAA